MFFRRQRDEADSSVESLRAQLVSVSDSARSGICAAARREIQLRHRIGLAELEHPAEETGFVEPASSALGADGLPEVEASRLTAAAVRGAILDRGCILVRGLLDQDEAGRIVAGIDRALAARDSLARGESTECGHFEHLDADPRYDLQERYWVESAGGLWTADCPFLATEIYGRFGDSGLVSLAREYMGEQPLLSVQKGTLRKVTVGNDVVRSIISKGSGGGWHQDGRFLGPVKALNVWISLSRCGDVAPGMDLVPQEARRDRSHRYRGGPPRLDRCGRRRPRACRGPGGREAHLQPRRRTNLRRDVPPHDRSRGDHVRVSLRHRDVVLRPERLSVGVRAYCALAPSCAPVRSPQQRAQSSSRCEM